MSWDDGVPDYGRFVVIEGLSGVGKTTVATAFARLTGFVELNAIEGVLDDARRVIDGGESVQARYHFYLAANFHLAERVAMARSLGRDIIVESYFARTVATHRGLGAIVDGGLEVPRAWRPDLGIWLTVDEEERRRRLAARDAGLPKSKWHERVEAQAAAEVAEYRKADLRPIDTTNASADVVAAQIARLLSSEATDARGC